jgi:hypothetical protein
MIATVPRQTRSSHKENARLGRAFFWSQRSVRSGAAAPLA